MKIPKTFLLKGKKWKVKLVAGLCDDDGEKVQGLTSYDDRLIEIEPDQTKEQLKLTFWHEYAHAFLFEAHLNMNDGWVDTLIEEIICEATADAIVNRSFSKVKL